MNEVIPLLDRKQLLDYYEGLSEERLLEALKALTYATIENIMRLACVVHLLEDKYQRDLRKFKFVFVPYVRAVWRGEMRPETIAHFIITEDSRRPLIPLVGSLPEEEQLKLSDGERVPLVVPLDDEGNYSHRMEDPLDLTPAQVDQVFAPGKLRSEGEQRAILEDKRREAKKPKEEKVVIGNLVLDIERGGAMVGTRRVSWADMEAALRYKRKR